MNERYYKIANEVWCSVSQRIGLNDFQRQALFEKEYAKMIVKECAKLFYDLNEYKDAEYIKQHFGVEE